VIGASIIIIKDSFIQYNTGYGIYSLSNFSNITIDSTKIEGNGAAQIFASVFGFPKFNSEARSTAIRIPPTPGFFGIHPHNQYILMADGVSRPTPGGGGVIIPNGFVNVSGLNVNLSELGRFYPTASIYRFDPRITHPGYPPPPSPPQIELFEFAITAIADSAFVFAGDLLRQIIDEFPDTDEALEALAILPYVAMLAGEDMNEVYQYIESIDNEFLTHKRIEALARINLLEQEYFDAIVLYEWIINHPPTCIDQMMAEIEQAYSYYKIASSGSRNRPAFATHRPNNYQEYLQIQQAILNRINNHDQNGEGREEVEPTQEELQFSMHNYPNPFNPVTTIKFTLPTEGKVRLEIFNIRGQRVKTLTNDFYHRGQHSVYWNGTNDIGQNVSSGIYFYRLQSEKYNAVQKMILMK
jgi:hypothetical protein